MNCHNENKDNCTNYNVNVTRSHICDSPTQQTKKAKM